MHDRFQFLDGNTDAVRNLAALPGLFTALTAGRNEMNSVIYLVGLIVVVMAILSFFGLR